MYTKGETPPLASPDPSTSSAFSKELTRALDASTHLQEDSRKRSRESIIQACKEAFSKKRRRLKASADWTTMKLSERPVGVPGMPNVGPLCSPQLDTLCQIKSLCKLDMGPSSLLAPPKCFGYLGMPSSFKHLLFSRPREGLGGDLRISRCYKVVDLNTLLLQKLHDKLGLNPISRLKLAHRIAGAVLQYHSTSWITENFRLKDLSYFTNSDKISDGELQSLHVNAWFSHSDDLRPVGLKSPTSDKAPATTLAPSFKNVRHEYGINNLILFSLGVVLLELGYCKPLESFCEGRGITPVVMARELAESDAPLGLRYQRIIQRCLQCNFGFGTDLSKPELQSAVYRDVVCPLEDMIKSLTLE
jgi:hypothetical protein